MTRLMLKYKNEIAPALKSELQIGNVYGVPKLDKIVINAGVGRVLQNNPKGLEAVTAALAKITGQKPVITRAKKAISGFKIREGQTVGLVVTLRGKRMYDFLDKLVNIVMPRTRDFRGLSRSGFDHSGNYNLGLREHMVFPEIGETGPEGSFGFQITIATTAKNDNDGYALLKQINFHFKD